MLVDGRWTAAYKEYSITALNALNEAALQAMMQFPEQLPAAARRDLAERVAWPATVVERHSKLSGFLMRRVPPEYTTRLRLTDHYVDKLAQVQLLLNTQDYLIGRDLVVDDVFRLEFLRDTAQAIDAFHQLDLVVGDLSPNNLLFSRTTRPRCFFIDCDAMRLRGTSVLPQVETTDWEVTTTAAEELATAASDRYKFALLCVRLFAGDQTTRDVAALHRLGFELRRLAERGLVTEPNARPSLADWLAPLDRALDAARAPMRSGPASMTGAPVGAPPMRPAGTRTTRPAPTRQAPMPRTGPVITARPSRPAGAPSPPKRGQTLRPRFGTVLKVTVAALLVVCAVPRLSACQQWWDTLTAAEVGTANGTDTRSGGSLTSADQATALANLLAVSNRDRRKIAPAVQKVIRCTDPSGAAVAFQQAGAGRTSALRRARNLETDQLQNGTRLRATLLSALAHSAAADAAYARWARAVARSGCRSAAMTGADRKQGDSESRLATSAKKQFVALWTPVAREYGERVVSYQEI